MSRSNSRKRAVRPHLHRLGPTGRCKVTGKVRWPARAGARQHLRWLKASSEVRDASRISSYHCPHCGDWHVGHRPQKEEIGRAHV